MTDVHIFLNSNYDWENSIITSSLVNYQCLSEFCNAKYISIIENKQRITRKNNYQWRSMLPYNRPDCNITPEDKANAHCPTFSAGRPNYSSKMQHQMSLFTKWDTYTSTPRKRELKSTVTKRTLFYAHQKHNQNKYQNENYVKKGYISEPK